MVPLSTGANILSHLPCIQRSASRNQAFSKLSTTVLSRNIICTYNKELRQAIYYHQQPNCDPLSTLGQSLLSTRSLSYASIENDSLPINNKESLLKGLKINTVPAEDDGHPLAVYTIANDENNGGDVVKQQKRTPVLLLHGRTWSSVPVYHLVGGHRDIPAGDSAQVGESRSLIEALYNTDRIQPYAMDFRGFGGTPKDDSGFVEPLKCVRDVLSVLNWIQSSNAIGETGSEASKPALLGWSHGALIAQIAAQRHPNAMSRLILYGSIYNPNIKYSIPPPPFPDDSYKNLTDHDDFPVHEMASQNEYGNATEDFTHNNIVSNWFAEAALICDPIKVQWWNLHQLNECHPSLVKVPTMVIAGDLDPYAPLPIQAELFTHLGKGVDRVWSIIANADHAVHLSDKGFKLVENVRNFLELHN